MVLVMDSVQFKSNFFVNNRQKLRKLFSGTAPIVISANGLLQRSGDTTFPFQQDSSFWYLTGINDPDLILVIDKTKEYIITPKRSASLDKFDGAIDSEALSLISGVSTILGESAGWKVLSARLKKVKHVATLAALPAYIEQIGLYTNPARSNLVSRMKEVNSGLELLDLRDHLTKMRSVKQPSELNAINKAIEITAAGMSQVLSQKRLKKYLFEYEIEAGLSAAFRSGGADGHAFSPIVASGENACTIHYISNNSRLKKTDLVVVDVGAEVSHYAADITRTYSIGGKASSRQRNVFEAVKDVQDYALSQLKPGVVIKDYEKIMEQYMGEKLRELSLIKSISTDTVRKYFPHLVSHFLGLDAHDAGDYSFPIEANMVITCEPGIYIPEEGIGVRIEDDVLITPDGNEVLSRNLPRSLE